MAVEIQLPDLPEIAIGGGPRPPGRARQPWHLRLRDGLSSYLPLLLMGTLALATWWLVKNTPGALPDRQTPPDTGLPDYTMRSFVLQRYAPDGRQTARLEGQELRHYTGDNRIEIDALRLQAFLPDGRVIEATARRAVSNDGATELQLQGGAEVTGVDSGGRPVEIRSEFLHAFIETEIVRTHLPVTVKQGASQWRAGGLVYDGRARRLDFNGPVRAWLAVTP
jgi:lipopolysaccharide export system protein LptC